MTPSEFRTELKKLKGGYLFCGEEDYLKRHYLSSLRKTAVEEGDVFNHIIISFYVGKFKVMFGILPYIVFFLLSQINCFSVQKGV